MSIGEIYSLLKGRKVWNQAFDKLTSRKPLPIVFKFDLSPKAAATGINDYISKHGLNIDDTRILDQTVRTDGYISYFVLYSPVVDSILEAPAGDPGPLGPNGPTGPEGEKGDCRPCIELSSSEGGSTESSSEPTTSSSEPTVSSSEPTTSSSEPTVSSSEPTTSSSEPTASSSEPTTSSSEPTTSSSSNPEECCCYVWRVTWNKEACDWTAVTVFSKTCVTNCLSDYDWNLISSDPCMYEKRTCITSQCNNDSDCVDISLPSPPGSAPDSCKKKCYHLFRSTYNCCSSAWGTVTFISSRCGTSIASGDEVWHVPDSDDKIKEIEIENGVCCSDGDCSAPSAPTGPTGTPDCKDCCKYVWSTIYNNTTGIFSAPTVVKTCIETCGSDVDWTLVGGSDPCEYKKTIYISGTNCDTDCPCADTTAPSTGSITIADSCKCATLTVTKTVVGGSKVVSDFTLKIDALTVTSGVANYVLPGPKVVSEVTIPKYTVTYGGDCDSSGNVTIACGTNKACTVTNTYVPASCCQYTWRAVYNNTTCGWEEATLEDKRCLGDCEPAEGAWVAAEPDFGICYAYRTDTVASVCELDADCPDPAYTPSPDIEPIDNRCKYHRCCIYTYYSFYDCDSFTWSSPSLEFINCEDSGAGGQCQYGPADSGWVTDYGEPLWARRTILSGSCDHCDTNCCTEAPATPTGPAFFPDPYPDPCVTMPPLPVHGCYVGFIAHWDAGLGKYLYGSFSGVDDLSPVAVDCILDPGITSPIGAWFYTSIPESIFYISWTPSACLSNCDCAPEGYTNIFPTLPSVKCSGGTFTPC